MSTDTNRALVRGFVDEIFVKGNADAVDKLMAPDFTSHTFPSTGDGRADMKAAIERVHGALSDVTFTVDQLVAEGDMVAALLTSSATQTGELMGMPASGKRYQIGEMHLFRIRDAQVVEHWHYHDALGMMKQLGAMPG
ncbi:MAG: ester cyclase [Chloroflexota bacterium]